MAYKIVDRKYSADDEVNGLLNSICAIYADREADLPDADEQAEKGIAYGSWAWLAEEDTFATLKSTGLWKKSGDEA